MRNIKIINDKCFLSLTEEEINILNSEKDIYDFDLLSLFIFQNLIDNGQADIEFKTITFDTEVLYNVLNKNDIIGLDLPKFSSHKFLINTELLLSDNNFSYKYCFYDIYPHGNKFKSEIKDGILYIDNTPYLISLNISKSIECINNHNLLPSEKRNIDINLKSLAILKKLKNNDSNIFFDSYLENEDVIIPEKINIHIEQSGNNYNLLPEISSNIDESFQKNFNIYPSVRNVYASQEKETTKRKRIILKEEQIEQLKVVKSFNKTKDNNELINKISESPSDYFDPEIIDISEFYSDRVIEIGIYQPKFSRFITPYKSDWLPGINIDFRNNGADQIIIHNEEELEELTEKIEIAEQQSSNIVEFNDHSIPMAIAKELQKLAIRQFNSKIPIEEIDGEEVKKKKVLIILENTDDLEYKSNETFNEDDKETNKEIKHRLYSVENLNENIALKSHQQEGIAWLQNLYKENYDGCLLADDMGLGKTLQVLYFIEWIGHLNESCRNDKPVLIIAPISLLENWQMEYARFFNNHAYKILPLYGSQPFEKKTIDKILISLIEKRQIILTNYETLRTYQLSLCVVDFRLVILDEAQKIKTPGTLITSSAKALKSDFKIAMSGTPVENSLLDLWCITDFACPGLLSSAKKFSKKYQSNLKKESIDLVKVGEELRNEIGIFFKRRLKKDVAKDLPLKIRSTDSEYEDYFKSYNLKRIMPEEQLQYYKDVINLYSKQSDDTGMLRYIGIIKEISDHPYLYDDSLHDKDPDELIRTSAKLITTVKILDDILLKKEKVILFAERRETQKMLQKVIKQRYGILAPIINGDIPTITQSRSYKCNLSRQETIHRFSGIDGFAAIILSPIAAGVGLNIVAANHVIHYSRHWNPAKEEQATDRAYRIGQQKDVYVYYPMAISEEFKSFDLILNDLLERKLSLASHTLFPTQQAEVSLKDFSSIFNL